jgi:arylsulfatase A-like enzyme
MADVNAELSRRELLKVGGALAGGMLAAPAATWLLARRTARPFPASVPASKAERPNVVLIVLDTVRADHLSCYGYGRATTPNLDAFAAGSRLYANALSPSYWTIPSHVSLFTGLPTSAHGATWLRRCVGPELVLLPEQLREAGYRTAGFSCNHWAVAPRYGFDRGFQTFWCAAPRKAASFTLRSDLLGRAGGRTRHHKDHDADSPATDMHRRLARWFAEEYEPQRPFFVFVNYIEAHGPYLPPLETLRWASRRAWRKWRSRGQASAVNAHTYTGADFLSPADIEQLADLYDDELSYVDEKLGELLRFLRRSRLDETTLIVITADHGECLGEHHLMSHLYSLYEPLVRVPLIVRHGRGFPPGREERLVQSHDVYPTILELGGVEWTPGPEHNCRSLLAAGAAEPRCGFAEHLAPMTPHLARVTELYPRADYSRFLRRLRAVQRGRMKLIRSSAGDVELYDLAADPLELRDLAADRPDAVTKLSKRLDDWLGSFEHYRPAPPGRHRPEEASPEELDSMRGLGYI